MAEARNLATLGPRFEDFVGALFRHLGLQVQQNTHALDRGADLTVRAEAIEAVVEVKLYSSMTPSSRSILQALEHLEHARFISGASIGILTTNSRMPPS